MQTPYTEHQKQEFKDRFRARRTRQLVLTVPVIALVVGASFLRRGHASSIAGIPASVFVPMFFVAVVGMLVFSFFNWRCPACNAYLGRGLAPRFCAKCGVELQS